MRKILIGILVICLMLTGCSGRVPRKDTTSVGSAEEKPESLKVYLTGDEMWSVITRKVLFYFSSYTIGGMYPVFMEYGNDGHILHDALEKFEAETKIHLDIQYFHLKSEMEEQLAIDRKRGTMPDVILLDDYSHGGWDKKDSLYRFMGSDWFYDVTPFMEEEGIYNSQEYYNGVLEAGLWQEKQLLLPIQFNLSTLYAAKEDMGELGIFLQKDMSWEEMLQQLETACTEVSDKVEAVDYLESQAGLEMITAALWQASGAFPVDYEKQEVTLDREVFEDMAEFYKQYLKMEYRDQWDQCMKQVAGYTEEAKEDWNLRMGEIWALGDNRDAGNIERAAINDWVSNGVFYLEGGNSRQVQYHSFIGQGAYLDTIYRDMQKNMEIFGIPQAEDDNSYTALIQLCGGVMKETEHPYYSYLFLKYLMDQSYFPYCTISVNRKATEEMLDTLCTLEYELDPLYGMFEGVDKKADQTIVIKPLSEELRGDIESMLDHIGGGVLPSFSVYMPIMTHLKAYALEYEDMDTAYENAMIGLETHLEELMSGQ